MDTILYHGMEGGVTNRALRSTKGTHQKVGAWKKLWGGGYFRMSQFIHLNIRHPCTRNLLCRDPGQHNLNNAYLPFYFPGVEHLPSNAPHQLKPKTNTQVNDKAEFVA